jgi:hypothetical protein
MKPETMRLQNRVKRPGLSQRLKTPDKTVSIALAILEGLDHPVALSIAIKLRYGDYKGVVESEIKPSDFSSLEDFRSAYQAVKLLSKYPYFDTGIDRSQVALQSFYDAERVCLETNARFRRLREGRGVEPVDPAVQAVITMAQRKITRILGEADVDSISKHFGWGPGASIGVRGQHTSVYNKFSGPLDVTRNCLAMGAAVVNSSPSWANAICKTGEFPSVPVSVLKTTFETVTGSEIIFVPKNAKTDRVIAIEPSLNGYVQKGFGRYIRKRLRERAGVDLNDQSINQSLAQYGSRTNELATIDLSMASDTIARELVRELLSDEWFELLSTCRCEQGTIKLTNETVWFQKFSSMGNAYTFELESLIFYALSRACVDQLREEHGDGVLNTVSVYGDDLIVPSYAVDLLLRVLSYCGFTVNLKKSYFDGPFRESCGKDYFLGTDVRPFFLKERIDNVEALYRVANSVRRISHRNLVGLGCDGDLLAAWSLIVRQIPMAFRNFIPEGFGDVGLIGNFDEASPSVPRDGWEGYRVRAMIRVPLHIAYKETSFGYTSSLFLARPMEIPADGRYIPRSRTSVKMANLLVRDWYNLGPWML